MLDKMDFGKFLQQFGYSNYTLQFFQDHKPKAVHYTDEPAPLLTHLATGVEPFFMVNPGDGKVHGDHKTCRSQASVTDLVACFIDTDSCPVANVAAYLKKINLKPHCVVETSPGKFHFYFLIEHVPATKQNIIKWKAVQEALCYFSDAKRTPTGCDPSMKDHSRVMRIPGFTHLKTGFCSSLRVLQKAPAYTLEGLFLQVNAQAFLEKHSSTQYNLQQYQLPTGETPQGSRHYDMAAFLAHLLNKGVSEDIALHAFYGHCKLSYTNADEFLPGGSRNGEVLRFLAYRKTEDAKVRLEHAEQITDAASDKFALPDSFYYELPGLGGELVRAIDGYSYIKNPPFTWAASIAALGSLRALYTQTNLGHAPANYFLCLAPTGTGKNYAIEVFQNTFAKLGLTNFLQSKLRSDQGLLRFLQENGGTGLMLADEAEYFLSMLDNKNAPAYIRNCKSILLELYTSTNKKNLSFGLTGDKKQKPTVLNNPRLNYVGYGVVSALDNVFSEGSIQDGLLQRFIVITDFRDVYPNENFKPAAAVNGTCYQQLHKLCMRYRLKLTNNIEAVEKLLAEAQAETDAAKKTAAVDEIKAIKALVSNNAPTIIKFAPDAEHAYRLYASDLMKRRNNNKSSVLSGLYTRAAEQVGRMACAVAENIIDKNLVDYLVSFADSRISALEHYCSENLAPTTRGRSLQKDLNDLRSCVAHLQRKYKGAPVAYRDIARSFRIRSSRELKELLDTAADTELLTVHSAHRNGTVGRLGTAYSVTSALLD